MVASIVINGDVVSSQWFAVICIGLVFFLVQLLLTLRFYSRMRRHERVLKRLSREFEKGGDGRKDVEAVPANFTWLRWVLSSFPADTKHPPGNLSREDVLQELDTRIASNGDYLLLQRMGVMAPLLGVVLTVIGFYWLHVGEEDQSLQTILLAVTPLVSGVGTGAVLALINQALLHVAGNRAESLRMTARTWFDAVIWSHIGLDTQAATVKAVRAMERLAASMSDAAQRYTSTTTQIGASSTSMKDAALQFRSVVEAFGAQIKGIPTALNEVRHATSASAGALEELIRVGSRAVANLDVSVAAFRTTLDRDFNAAAKLHHHSSHALAESVDRIGDATTRLISGSEELKNSLKESLASSEMAETMSRATATLNSTFRELSQFVNETKAAHKTLAETTNNLNEVAKQLRHSMESDVAPSQRAIQEAAKSFARMGTQLSEFTARGVAPATQQLASLHDTLRGLEEAVDAIKKFSSARPDIDRLNDTLARAAEISDAISALPEQIQHMLEQKMDHNSVPSSASGRLFNWLGRRPR